MIVFAYIRNLLRVAPEGFTNDSILQSFVTKRQNAWNRKTIVRFSLLFFPKATNLKKMAGLLTYSLFTAFPFLARETVAMNGKQTTRDYSSGYCPGFTPGSLLILKIQRIFGTISVGKDRVFEISATVCS